ncbi:MAG: 50S ribosomal protein L25/general stress protein Ctc [Chrysiogenetes bacterium]|nr:50S ribosomal protein L25/general stress protein Ctc [Chrysiogenetes bacterium]
MAEQLAVEIRTETGKGPARRLRMAGKIPGVFYGRNEATVMFAVDPKALRKALSGKTGLNTLISLKSSDSALEGKLALLHDVCRDPASRELKHVDLLSIDPKREVTVKVPVHVHGRSKGVVAGGILDQIRHELEVRCLPGDIPSEIQVDVTELDTGESIHVSDVALPSGVTAVDEDRFTIVTIVPPKGMSLSKEEEAAEAAAAEGEGAAATGEAKE